MLDVDIPGGLFTSAESVFKKLRHYSDFMIMEDPGTLIHQHIFSKK